VLNKRLKNEIINPVVSGFINNHLNTMSVEVEIKIKESLWIPNVNYVNVYAIIIVLCISIDKSIIRTRSLRNTHSQETQHLSWETL
jgi:hypothetical protein